MPVPYTFGTATAAIPLSQLDSNFSTAITIGNTAVQLGNTVTTLNNMTLANVTISSGNVTLTNVSVTTANVSGTANVSSLVVLTNETVLGNTAVTGNVTASINVTGAKLIPTGTSVTGNGLYLPAANALGLSTNGTNAVYIDASQNVGIGVTPSAWFSGYKALETGSGSLVYPGSATNTQLWNNLYVNTAGNVTYKSTGIGGLYSIGGGGNAHTWYYAASGTAGTTATLTQAMTLDASGNLGVGISSIPSGVKLYVYQPNASTDVKVQVGTTTGTNSAYQAFVNNTVTTVGTENSSGGNLVSGSSAYATILSNNGAYPIQFGTNNTVRATLDSSGNLLVGTTTSFNGSGCVLQATGTSANQVFGIKNSNANPFGMLTNYSAASPNGAGNEFVYCSDSTTLRASLRSNGGLANYSANNSNLSDRREKTNFAPAKSYLDVICAIPVQTFNYIDQNMEDDGGLTLGVVAQDVQAVAPELVMESNWASKDDEPKMRLSIYQTDLQYALMKCIQEQQALIQSLTDRLTVLEAK